MKTSLKKPIGIFVQFLKGLESENDNRRKTFRDAEGKWMEWMFAELLHNTEKKIFKLDEEKRGMEISVNSFFLHLLSL